MACEWRKLHTQWLLNRRPVAGAPPLVCKVVHDRLIVVVGGQPVHEFDRLLRGGPVGLSLAAELERLKLRLGAAASG
jgi:hypothetical protein